MNEDPSLEKYRIGREILKQCFTLEFKWHIQADEDIRSSLVKSLCAYDPEAAFNRANSNTDFLQYRVYDLVAVSEAFAEFDEERSLEILEYAYSEVHSIGQRVKSLFGAISDGRIECFDRLVALTTLIKGFVKRLDIKKANKIAQEIRLGFSSLEGCKDAETILRELEIYASLDFLKCREAETMELEKANISLTISRIRYLFKVLSKKAQQVLVENLLEFLDKFIDKFPEASHERVCLLLDLSEVLVKFEGQRACELAELAMSEAESIEFIDPKYHIKYVKILLMHGEIEEDEANEAINRALECINVDEQNDLHAYVSNLLSFTKAIAPFDEILTQKLVEEFVEKSLEKIRELSGTSVRHQVAVKAFTTITRASEILAPYNQVQAFEMLNLALENRVIRLGVLSVLNEEAARPYYLAYGKAFKAVAKVNPLRAKEVTEDLKDSIDKLHALTSVVKGIISHKTWDVDVM